MLINIIIRFFRIIPHKSALSIGKILGLLLRLFLWKKVDRCEARCVKSLGVGITTAREIIKGSFMNLGMSVIEFIRLPIMKNKIEELVYFSEESQNILREALSRGKGVLLLTAHMANWEMAAARATHAKFPIYAIFTPQREDNINKIIYDIREDYGLLMMNTDKFLRGIFKAIKSGGAIEIMQDLDARREGVITNFFGIPASTRDGIIKLHNKFNSPVVTARFIRDKNNPEHHILEIKEILSDRPNFGKDIHESLELCNRIIESWINDRPELWFWMMDRWEYTLGKNI